MDINKLGKSGATVKVDIYASSCPAPCFCLLICATTWSIISIMYLSILPPFFKLSFLFGKILFLFIYLFIYHFNSLKLHFINCTFINVERVNDKVG